MNIIFVSNNMAKAKTLPVWQLWLAVFALILFTISLTLWFVSPQEANKTSANSLPSKLKQVFINPQKHLDAYAIQLGELQARIMRLDAQSERLKKIAGEKAAPPASAPALNVPNAPTNNGNQGGPLVLEHSVTEAELQAMIADLTAKIEQKDEDLSALEASLLQRSVLKDLLPNASPINAAYNTSSYGWRSDPFTGGRAFHEGLDFSAASGTPIYAAASGIVTTAEHTHDYGKIVKIDHGSGLETRYAHASKLLVPAGARVEKGQIIAQVGNTGRSTGPHLHYEIRLNGNALDPRKYLQTPN